MIIPSGMARPFKLLSLVALCMFGALDPAVAEEQDTQLWIYAVATGDIAEDTRLTVDATARWREQRLGDEQQTLRFNIDKQVADGIRLGGGGGLFETGGATEIRPHQQIGLRLGRFSARTRFEQRFFDGADRMELRFRQLFRYTQPITRRFRVSMDGEYLGLAQRRDRGSTAPRDQWRARVALRADISEPFAAGIGYLLIHTPRTGEPDQLNHVPQVYLTWRF